MKPPLQSAVILAVGTELTTGATRDTNSGQLAAELTPMGVEVLSVVTLPDRLERVRDAFAAALDEADLVVSTGGLGPTPDDLTREAIAAATGLDVRVDPQLKSWLRELFQRRGVAMPEANLKQAWLVPGAHALRNGNGTAPGWWLELPDGKVIVALPGPPREMWPMWQADVRPRLGERGVGVEVAHEVLRLTGIGESALVELIGEDVLRRSDPEVATYSRPDAVDVRVSARGAGAAGRVAAAVNELLPRLEPYVFARGDEGWPEVLGRLLGNRTLATVEIGTGGQLLALLGKAAYLVRGEVVHADDTDDELRETAERARSSAGADVGLVVRTNEGSTDTRVLVAVAGLQRPYVEERTAFLTGGEGRRRAALAATAVLWASLRREAG